MNKAMLDKQQQKAVGHANGKLILIGEHAVVHGYPSIAIPFTLIGATAEVTQSHGPAKVDCGFFHGELQNIPNALIGLSACITETLNRAHQAGDGLTFQITSSIPPERGLGSSAAVAAAITRSLLSYYRASLLREDLLALVNIAETYAHGKPSGIDAEAVVRNKPFWFVKGQSVQPLEIIKPISLVIADSGQPGDTKTAVSAVHALLESKPGQAQASLERIGQMTTIAKKALSQGNTEILGLTLNEAQVELSLLGVSDALIDHLIGAAHKAGALGAKLTGSGSGGCILALARDANHACKMAGALSRAGAHKVWCFTVGKGARHERDLHA